MGSTIEPVVVAALPNEVIGPRPPDRPAAVPGSRNDRRHLLSPRQRWRRFRAGNRLQRHSSPAAGDRRLHHELQSAVRTGAGVPRRALDVLGAIRTRTGRADLPDEVRYEHVPRRSVSRSTATASSIPSVSSTARPGTRQYRTSPRGSRKQLRLHRRWSRSGFPTSTTAATRRSATRARSGTSRTTKTPTSRTVPTAQEKTGDFSDFVDGSTGALIPIYDPATIRSDRQPFPGNIIPASRISPHRRRHFSSTFLIRTGRAAVSAAWTATRASPRSSIRTFSTYGALRSTTDLTPTQSLHFSMWRNTLQQLQLRQPPDR